MNNCIEMIEKDSVTTLVKFNSPMIGIQSSLLLFSDKKKTDFCFIIFSASVFKFKFKFKCIVCM